MVSEGQFGGKPTAFYDLFWLGDGEITQHWDAIEGIPPQEQWEKIMASLVYATLTRKAGNFSSSEYEELPSSLLSFLFETACAKGDR